MLVSKIEKMIKDIESLLDDDNTKEEEIGESSSTGVKGVNSSFRLTNKENKKFIFKPSNGEHTSKWRYVPPHEQYTRERAAYLVDKCLTWGLVPHTIIKTHDDEIGSLQDWVTGTTKSDKTLESYLPQYIWKAGLFDILIGNIDRHSKNWFTMKDKPILIDHGYSFPVSAEENDQRSVILSRFAYRIWKKPIPNILYEDIKHLKDSELQEHIKSLVGIKAFKLFNERLNTLLNTKVAYVSNYNCTERVTKAPKKKE